MPTFTKRSELPVPRADLYAWHARTWVSERPPVYEQVLRETGRMESPK